MPFLQAELVALSPIYWEASQLALVVKRTRLPMQKTQETQVQSLCREDLPEEGMATHTSSLAWRMPRTEEPGGLQSMG